MEDKNAEITSIRERLQDLHKLSNNIELRIINGAVDVEDSFGDMLSYENILEHTNIIADRIVQDCRASNDTPVLISLMDGGFIFASLLQEALIARGFLFHYTTMQVSSYDFTESGKLKISSHPKISLGERSVIVLDEVWDTGKTFAGVKEYILNAGAKNVDLAVLVDKAPELGAKYNEHPIFREQPRWLYSCFTISPDEFLIGMGLDYSGWCRNLRDIKAVRLDTLPTETEKALLGSIKQLNKRLQELLSGDVLEVKNTSERKSPLLANSMLASNVDAKHDTPCLSRGMSIV